VIADTRTRVSALQSRARDGVDSPKGKIGSPGILSECSRCSQQLTFPCAIPNRNHYPQETMTSRGLWALILLESSDLLRKSGLRILQG